MLTRRQFLEVAARAAPAMAGLGTLAPHRVFGASSDERLRELLRAAPRARYWASVADAGADCRRCHGSDFVLSHYGRDHDPALVQCFLCARRCPIPKGARGDCGARMNVGGELRSLVYGRPLAVHVDPIEKKPFYHFLPGAAAYSLGTAGCPLHCKFCQNWTISQAKPEDQDAGYVAPSQVAGAAASRRIPVVAYTYNEATVFAEYMLDTAAEARRLGLRNALISCGFMSEAPLADMCRALDAIKIDLKGYSPDFYRNVCRAELAPVLRSIRQVARSGVHLEIVNLVVPTLNDSDRMLQELSSWVAGEVGPDVPVHFTRFHPDYQLRNLAPTPVATLERAREIARAKGIRYAYVGNVPGHPGNHTECPSCRRVVVRREGFLVSEVNVQAGRCRFCRARVAGVWS